MVMQIGYIVGYQMVYGEPQKASDRPALCVTRGRS